MLPDSTQAMIGGLFAREPALVDQASCNSLWAHWTGRSAANFLFHNARSAIAYILKQYSPARFWVPAYICVEVPVSVEGLPIQVMYYPLDTELNPIVGFLEQNIMPGDAVLVVNYFGRPASKAVRDIARTRAENIWVEDCAQSVDTGLSPYGDFQVYSPRKLVATPDGGLLVDPAAQLPVPSFINGVDAQFTKPFKMREADKSGSGNELWYQAYLEAEGAMRVSMQRPFAGTRQILQKTNIRYVSKKRVDNYQFLYQELGRHALYSDLPDGWVPMGFPILSSKRELLLSHLHANRVFAPCHWRKLMAPARSFAGEHTLSQQLITLPCDHRYSLTDMERIVSLVREIEE